MRRRQLDRRGRIVRAELMDYSKLPMKSAGYWRFRAYGSTYVFYPTEMSHTGNLLAYGTLFPTFIGLLCLGLYWIDKYRGFEQAGQTLALGVGLIAVGLTCYAIRRIRIAMNKTYELLITANPEGGAKVKLIRDNMVQAAGASTWKDVVIAQRDAYGGRAASPLSYFVLLQSPFLRERKVNTTVDNHSHGLQIHGFHMGSGNNYKKIKELFFALQDALGAPQGLTEEQRLEGRRLPWPWRGPHGP